MSQLKDTVREKAPSNKTPALTKSVNMGFRVVCKSNQVLIRGIKLKQNSQKNKIVTGKTPFLIKAGLYDEVFLSQVVKFFFRQFPFNI